MKLQNYETENRTIKVRFIKLKKDDPERFSKRLKLSWSNWGFGMEPLKVSLARLKENNIGYIELHGNRYGDDVGYDSGEVKKLLSASGIGVSGIVEPGGQMSMLDTNGQRLGQLNKTIDDIRDKFGFSAIQTGRTLLLRDIVAVNGK